jgi:hypothetical protein
MSIPGVAPEGQWPEQAGPMSLKGLGGLVNRVIA